MINVDTVLTERLPNFSVKHPILSRTLSNFLKYVLHEREFKQFETRYPYLEGFDFVEQVLEYFDFGYRVFDRELERLPLTGRLVIVSNHPIGSLDGLALLKMVGERRRDVKVIANEMLYAVKPLRSLLLPVDNVTRKTARDNIRSIHKHLDAEGAIIIFPAGEVSRFGASGIRDGRWEKGFLRFAKNSQSPVLPVHVNGRNSLFFYALSIVSRPLSGIWLVREMFKQASQHVDIRIGHSVKPEQYDGPEVTNDAKIKRFRKTVYKLGKGKCLTGFEPEYIPVAQAEHRQLLKKEIGQCELLGKTTDDMKIYLYRYSANSTIMREIGRLRELTFRYVKEGSGKRRDIDIYDHYYDHIILWDDQGLEIVGSYRLVQADKALRVNQNNTPEEKLYTQTLFEFTDDMNPYLAGGLELGRSFVQPAYWGKRSLDYLWFGIGAYLRKYPHITTLFGAVSLSGAYSESGKSALVHFYSNYFPCAKNLVKSSNPYHLCDDENQALTTMYAQLGEQSERFAMLKHYMKSLGESVPTLYKQYADVTIPGGTEFCSFNVDTDFADCIDGFVVVHVDKLKPSKRQRYIGH